MLSFLNQYLPASITASFKNPLRYFIRRQQGHIEAQLSLLQLRGVLPPVPPEALQTRVAGQAYGNFFLHGNQFIDDLEAALRKYGKSLADFRRILDFGAGCGRVIIPLSFRVDPEKLYGTDIDQEAIDWLSLNYPNFGGLSCNPCLPPTSHPDGFFDLIYSISVFTHLPEDMQFAWLDELRRITAPGGYLLLSFHGNHVAASLGDEVVQAVDERGFYYMKSAKGFTKGLPTFYQEAFHTHAYIEQHWGQYFDILDLIPGGIGNHQDLAVLRRN